MSTSKCMSWSMLKLYLFSILDLIGLTTKIEQTMIKIWTRASTIAKGSRNNSLYILDSSVVIMHVSVASQTMQDKIKLLHLRMWRISETGLVELEKQNFTGVIKWKQCKLRQNYDIRRCDTLVRGVWSSWKSIISQEW